MNELFGMIVRFLRAFHFWIFVCPWEKAVRVRCGNRVRRLDSGFHLKLPIIDRIYLQSDRMRITAAGKQTVTTKDAKVITICSSVGYHIDDIEQLYRTLHHAEDVITQIVKSRISDYIARCTVPEISIEEIQRVIHFTSFNEYGIGGATLYVTDIAISRTYRLIGDYSEYTWGQKLNTDQSTTEKPIAA
jgi:regulator of protease activity HflC (stomatin/prohibitin superfamily)